MFFSGTGLAQVVDKGPLNGPLLLLLHGLAEVIELL